VIDQHLYNLVVESETISAILLGQLKRRLDAGETFDPSFDSNIDTNALKAKLACSPVILPKS
jgi:hypothetical protein